MKKFLLLVPALLIFAGCASTAPTMQTRYELDANDNLVQRQYMASTSNDNRLLETVAVVGLGIVGLYFVGEVFDIWDDDKPTTVAAPVNPALVPTSGSTQWETNFLQQTYAPVN